MRRIQYYFESRPYPVKTSAHYLVFD